MTTTTLRESILNQVATISLLVIAALVTIAQVALLLQ